MTANDIARHFIGLLEAAGDIYETGSRTSTSMLV